MNENSYHFTIGTYGTRLHGGNAPTVDRSQNQYGEPFVVRNEMQEAEMRHRMAEQAIYFSHEQRVFIENAIPEICEQGQWIYHIAACQPDHVHCLISSHVEPRKIRRWLKTWLTQRLNNQYGGRTWFVRDGSMKRIEDSRYFNNVVEYIRKQRATEG